MANLESGKQKLSIHNVYAICAHLKLELTEILPKVDEVIDNDSHPDKILPTGTEKITPSIEKALSKMRKTE